MIRLSLRFVQAFSLLSTLVTVAQSRILPDIPKDEACVPPRNHRCGDGECRENCSQSKMPFSSYCANFSANYQCHNGMCVASYTQCKNLTSTDMTTRAECTAPK